MDQPAIQDRYPDQYCHCYGCGRLNERGLHIRSFRDGDEVVCAFRPEAYHVAFPGVVYGGLIASLIDCHGIGAAAAFAADERGLDLTRDETPRFVTASLHVDYLRPTPTGVVLELRARRREVKGRKVLVSVTLTAAGETCARGELVAVEAPAKLGSAGR